MFKNKLVVRSLVAVLCWMQLVSTAHAGDNPSSRGEGSSADIELSRLERGETSMHDQFRDILDLAKQKYSDSSIQSLDSKALVEQFKKAGIDSAETRELLFQIRQFLENGFGLEQAIDRLKVLDQKKEAARYSGQGSGPVKDKWKLATFVVAAVVWGAAFYYNGPNLFPAVDCPRSLGDAVFLPPGSQALDSPQDPRTLLFQSGVCVSTKSSKCHFLKWPEMDYNLKNLRPVDQACRSKREIFDNYAHDWREVEDYTNLINSADIDKPSGDYNAKLWSTIILGGFGTGLVSIVLPYLSQGVYAKVSKYFSEFKTQRVGDVQSKIFKDLQALTGIPALPVLFTAFAKSSAVSIVDARSGCGIQQAAGAGSADASNDKADAEALDGPQ